MQKALICSDVALDINWPSLPILTAFASGWFVAGTRCCCTRIKIMRLRLEDLCRCHRLSRTLCRKNPRTTGKNSWHLFVTLCIARARFRIGVDMCVVRRSGGGGCHGRSTRVYVCVCVCVAARFHLYIWRVLSASPPSSFSSYGSFLPFVPTPSSITTTRRVLERMLSRCLYSWL